MRKRAGNRIHAKVRALLVLAFFVAAGGGVLFFAERLNGSGALPGSETSPVIERHQNGVAAEASSGGSLSFQQRRIILSMGQEPDTLFISWSGQTQSRSRQYLRYNDDKGDLPKSKLIKAEKTKVLNGQYCRYVVKLKDLSPGKKYYYEIGDGTIFDKPRSFEAPKQSGATKFLYFGDVQLQKSLKDYDAWGKMAGRIFREDSDLDFAVIGGDMVNVPTEKEQWDGFLANCDIFSRLPLMTAPGNHEGVHSNMTYKKIFAVPANGPTGLKEDFYYFDYGKCRFIVLDSSFLTDARRETLGKEKWNACEEAVEKWLRRTLRKNSKTWTVVVVHHPPYGMHDRYTVSPQLRKLWTPLMENGKVDIVLSGHQHLYMRSGRINGILYVMGNSGAKTSEYYNGYNAPLYSRSLYSEGPNYQIITATSSQLQLVSYNEKGLVIDETSLKKSLLQRIMDR